MLEILLIFYLARRIGNIAEKRGHKRRPNVVFFVVLWICGEILGAAMGAFFGKGNIYIIYAMALVGAALGTVIAFNIVQNLEDRNEPDRFTIDGDKFQ